MIERERQLPPSEQDRDVHYDLGRVDEFLDRNMRDIGFADRYEWLIEQERQLRKAVTDGIISESRATRYTVGRVLREEERSGVDFLTGLKNRRGFEREAEGMLKRLQVERTPVSCLAIDVDNFKSVNDDPGQGHRVGDLVLVHLGGLIKTTAGPDAIVGRRGGDEMAILAGIPMNQALDMATELNRGARDMIPEAVRATGLLLRSPITLSIGATSTQTTGGSYDLRHLLRTADMAAYEAKQGGKNQTVAYRGNPQ